MDKRTEYLLSCGIKMAWHEKSLENYTNDLKAKRIVGEYLKDARGYLAKGVGLYLWGANGAGKSHLMNTTFLELLGRRYSVRVFSMDELVDMYTSSWYSESEKSELNHILRNVQFLGVDEFGKNVDAKGVPVPLPDLVKRIMESVIRYRVQMHRPIWFASNTDPKYVRDVFSEDIASLLREAVIPVVVTGKDYRATIQQQHRSKLYGTE